MAKEYWYFIGGALAVVIPLLAVVAIKKLNLLDERPDAMLTYSRNGEQALVLHHFAAQNRASGARAPAVLLFHGGAWLYGNPRDFYPQCRFLAEQGTSCFAAQYRLGAGGLPDVQGAVADARAALDYLLDNAAALQIDPGRIVVGGGSAGGHLAAALGVGLPGIAPRERRPAALVLYNPMLDLSPGRPDHHLVKDYWQKVSPYQHIDADTPPALILLGSRDPEVPVATAQAFCDAVRAAGGRCELEVYEGQGHGFFHLPRFREATNRRVLEFLSGLKQE